jgi:hypothetical protein
MGDAGEDRLVPQVSRGRVMLPIRRNIALLSGAVAANTAMLQLIAAVAAISLDRVLEADGLLGLGPAIVLAGSGAPRG